MSGYRTVAFGLLALTVGACRENPAAVQEEPATQFDSVVPAGGAEGIDPNAPVVVRFTDGMMQGMEQYMMVHEGDVAGPVVPGTWTWTEDWTCVTFQPTTPLKPHTHYSIHLGGAMMDGDGHAVGFGMNGTHMGGQWATSEMMGGGMMGQNGSMMGSGWLGQNGSYGMVFEFTTA